ncbi:MAG: hypothetical protein A2Z16_09890 [Chloroflexi bacterium RBG_16_54_18]|nr:MAG: hypothetical protein A2Z16_09890 [Chloroflexi bacterium RBG_16_54_18]
MLSSISRTLTFIAAILYTVLGVLLFLFSSSLAPVFAWKVTPFVAMTVGAWSLGTAVFCWAALVTWKWSLVYSSLLYLWLFGVFQVLVVIAFRDRLQPAHPIAWLYLSAIIVSCLAAILGVVDWLRLRPRIEPLGEKVNRTLRILTFIVVAFVFLLGINAVRVKMGTFGTNAEIFPEVITLFTLRGFGALYLALSISGAPLLFNKGSAVFLQHIIGNSGLIVLIPLAAFLNFSTFDLNTFPTQLIYPGAYLLVGLVEGLVVYAHRDNLRYLRRAT